MCLCLKKKNYFLWILLETILLYLKMSKFYEKNYECCLENKNNLTENKMNDIKNEIFIFKKKVNTSYLIICME